jgi:hypothetical protein
MLTDGQLKDLSKKMRFPLEGVYFKDELPRVLKYNTAYIINLDNSLDEEGNENEGTHWTCLQVNKYPSGAIEPIFFDPYGAPPSEDIIAFVKNNCAKYLPHTNKDIQSLMNNACGFYCCAFLHYINAWEHRCKDLYQDVNTFMSYFDDLNTSIDWKKNEYILKMFFQSEDPSKRTEIDVLSNKITDEDEHRGRGVNDLMKIPVDVKYRN